MRVIATLAAIGLCAFTSKLQANSVDTFGISARSIALGNAVMTDDADAYQAYANPAALVGADENQFKLSFNLLNTDLALDDLNSLGSADPSGLPGDAFQSSKAANLQGSSLGIKLPLGKRLAFGLSGYLPSNNFGQLWGGASNDPGYLRYSDRQQRPAIFTALAFKVGNGWSIGAGSYYTLRARGLLQMSLSQEGSAARFQLAMEPVLLPYGSIQWKGNQFSWALLYRSQQDVRSSIDTDLELSLDSASLPFALQTQLAPFYDPETIRFGGAWKSTNYSLHASLEYAGWSGFVAPTVELRGSDLALVSETTAAEPLNLKDTWAYRLGMEYQLSQESTQEKYLRFGLEHHSSASPSTSSVVDLERNVLALGFGFQLDPAWFDNKNKARVELAFQQSLLSKKTLISPDKQTLEVGGSMRSFVGGLQYDL